MNALGRLWAGRVRGLCHEPHDERFTHLVTNLSHILHDAPASPDVRRAAERSWRFGDRMPVSPGSVWGEALVRRVRDADGLVVMAPIGPRLSAATVESWDVSSAYEGTEIELFRAPARIDTRTAMLALASGRPLWFGWLAAGPRTLEGALEPLILLATSEQSRDLASQLATRCEPLLRTYPDQCRAYVPFWPAPFDSETVTRVERPNRPASADHAGDQTSSS